MYYYEGCIIFSCFIRNPLKPSLYLQNDLLPEGTISGQNRHGYTISNVDRFHAGRYTCHADNGVGAAATAKIALQVLCKYKKLLFFEIIILKKIVQNIIIDQYKAHFIHLMSLLLY